MVMGDLNNLNSDKLLNRITNLIHETVFMNNLFLSLTISILISLVIGYPAMLLAKSIKLIDMPNSPPHKTHKQPTPLAGRVFKVADLAVIAIIFRPLVNLEGLSVLNRAFVV